MPLASQLQPAQVVEDAEHWGLVEAMEAERLERGLTDRGTLERLLGPRIRLDPLVRAATPGDDRPGRRRNALPTVL